MGFDLFSGVLDIAGLLLGLMVMFGGLWSSRGITVSCELHDRAAD